MRIFSYIVFLLLSCFAVTLSFSQTPVSSAILSDVPSEVASVNANIQSQAVATAQKAILMIQSGDLESAYKQLTKALRIKKLGDQFVDQEKDYQDLDRILDNTQSIKKH